MSRTVIIGAGVIGLSLAHELVRRGQDVVICDLRRPGSGSSAGNAGWIVPSVATPVPAPGLPLTAMKWMANPESPLYIKPRLDPRFLRWLWSFMRACREEDYLAGRAALLELCRDVMPAFDRLQEDGVEFEMTFAGLLVLGFSEEALDHHYEGAGDLESIGYRAACRLGREQVREMEPMLSDAVAGAVYIRDDRHVRPESLAQGLTTALWRRGVDIQSGNPVTGFERDGRQLTAVETPRGKLLADNFVIAAGGWTGALSASAGFALPIEAGKGYSITVDDPSFNLHYPLDLIEARAAVTPFAGALRFAGTMEISGVNLRYECRRANAIWRNAHKYLRHRVTGSRMRGWVGMRPMTPDGLPVIGRMPGSRNLYVASGHQMLGVTLAPTTAIALAQLMLGEMPTTSLAPFDPARFI